MDSILSYLDGITVNVLDIIVLAVLAISIYAGMKKGLVKMVFNLASYMLSFYITTKMYPIVSVFLRDNTSLFRIAKEKTAETLSIGEIVQSFIQQGEEAVISNLPLPENIQGLLSGNNVPPVYELLNVSTFEDYISSFLANTFLNIISAIAVFIIVAILMRLIVAALDIIAKLPVINKFNKAGGALAGLLIGFMAVWILITLYCLIFVGVTPDNDKLLGTSLVGRFFYNHGLLLKGFTNVFKAVG